MVAANALKILVVEDEAGIAELEQEVLERSGYQVKSVARGDSALECLEGCEDLALIVLDYRLPDMTGADIVATLGDRIATLPVLMITGFPDPRIERRMRNAGVSDYIVKDAGLAFLDNLPRSVHSAVEGHSV